MLASVSVKWKEVSPVEIELEICPHCKKPGYGHCYIEVHPADHVEAQRDGLYQCHHCGESGGLGRLRQIYGIPMERRPKLTEGLPDVEKCHQALLGDKEALEYLLNVRGFSMEIIRQQKLGFKLQYFRETKGEARALVIPYTEGGKCIWAKYRSLPPQPKTFSSPSGYDSVLYNADALVEGLTDIILFEGEADTIAALGAGLTNVCGVPGANIKKAEWINRLASRSLERVYICYDKDKVGQKAAQELAYRIGIDKCYRLMLPEFTVESETGSSRPGKDANDYFASGQGTLQSFNELIHKAVLFDIDGVASVKDAISELEDELQDRGVEPKYKTQWPDVNRLIGFDEGDVIDILAPEKIGKTTFGMNLLEHMVDQYREDAMLICLEMTQARLARKFVCMKSGIWDEIPKGHMEAQRLKQKFVEEIPKVNALLDGRDGKMYFCYPQYKTVEDIYQKIIDSKRRYGIKWVMVDNLQRLCDTTVGSKNRTQHLSEISKILSKLAKDLKIQMIRILQPHRVHRDRIVDTDDVDGASQIAKDCDCMIVLHRERTDKNLKQELDDDGFLDTTEGNFSQKLILNVGLSRYSGGGRATLYYQGATSRVLSGSRELFANIEAAEQVARTQALIPEISVAY